jgi:hypothetical protein
MLTVLSARSTFPATPGYPSSRPIVCHTAWGTLAGTARNDFRRFELITFLTVLSILLVLFSGFVCWQVLEQRKVIARMMENDDIADSEQEPELVITLRVLDPIALAKRESRSARVLADKLPVMVRKMVYQEVMKELEEEMTEREIDVDMQIEYR